MSDAVIQASGLVKRYPEAAGAGVLEVLRGIDFRLDAGQTRAIGGASGSGKSTLLNILGGLDKPCEGSVQVAGQSLSELGDRQLGRLRNRSMGFIYQFHHLLPEFSALENVAIALLLGDTPAREARDRAAAMLADVGLSERLDHKPAMLSGGERQRVAIARALVTRPQVVLADEPTGNLDERTAAQVQDLMLSLNESHKVALLIVTHDLSFARRCGQNLVLHEGRLEEGSVEA